MNSTSADALFTSSTSAMGTRGAGARANAWLDSASAAVKTAALRALFVIRRSPPASPAGVLAWRAGDAIRLQSCISRPGGLVITGDGEGMAAGATALGPGMGPPG